MKSRNGIDNAPLVSVFIKCRDDALFRDMALGWLARQTYKNIEIIHGDFDINRCNGQYVLVTDDDNVYNENAIEKMVAAAIAQKSDIVLFNIEVHWESNSDARVSAATNFAFPFSPYKIDGVPFVNDVLFHGVNSYMGACLFRRDFLVRNGLTKIERENAFVRRCMMHRPAVQTLATYLASHIIRIDAGYRTPHEYIADELDSYNYLAKYARAYFWTRRWREPISEMVRMLSMDGAFGAMSKLIPMNYIPQCSIHLVDHCNLNCKSCSHFSCLARAGDFELRPSDFRRDIRRLARITRGRVYVLELYGGEPLLHPNVTAFMKLARKYFPKSTIRLITNGILLPQQNATFWRAAHANKILISPTRYPIHVDWPYVADMARKYRVALDFFGGTGFCQRTLYHKPLDLNGMQNGALSYINCQHARCINLYRGRLYHCPVVAYIHYFNRQFNKNLRVCQSDWFDIYAKKITPRDVFDFCARPVPFCRYCMSRMTTYGHPWEQTKKDISEWTLQ